jgi:hypothetical protein
LEATKVANKAENKLVEPQKKRIQPMILQNMAGRLSKLEMP